MARNRPQELTNYDLSRVADPRPAYDSGDWLYLYGCRPWEAWQDGDVLAFAAKIEALVERRETLSADEVSVCPVCQGKPRRPHHYCLHCDRAGLDGRAEYPGLRVGEAMDEDWPVHDDSPARATRYEPDGRLKGGVG